MRDLAALAPFQQRVDGPRFRVVLSPLPQARVVTHYAECAPHATPETRFRYVRLPEALLSNCRNIASSSSRWFHFRTHSFRYEPSHLRRHCRRCIDGDDVTPRPRKPKCRFAGCRNPHRGRAQALVRGARRAPTR